MLRLQRILTFPALKSGRSRQGLIFLAPGPFFIFSVVTMNSATVRTPTNRTIPGLLLGCALFYSGCASSPETKTSAAGLVTGKAWNVPLSDETSIELEWIPAGAFTMGSPDSDVLARPDEKPQTQVTLTKGFWLGKTTVTIGQWKSLTGLGVRTQLIHMIQDDTLYDFDGKQETVRDYMHFSRDADPGRYLARENDNLPMYFVSWNDAMEFCRELNQRERAAKRLPAGYEYNLPTEAQWEYACRAGTTESTYAGPMVIEDGKAPVLENIAWYSANSPDNYTGKGFNVGGRNGGPHAVGQKQPNAWGLYDMTGNIWQWCSDWYGSYPGGNVTDPTGLATGADRVNRGGSFGSGARDERSANRAKNPPAEGSAYRGFRIALCPVR
jgi:formylglycine-generating enzyme required for sulfatase activity